MKGLISLGTVTSPSDAIGHAEVTPVGPLRYNRANTGPFRQTVRPSRCPLMALSGLSDALVTRSAFRLKADMPNEHVECPLMTQSGRWQDQCHCYRRGS
jgi:hypothetical protein